MWVRHVADGFVNTDHLILVSPEQTTESSGIWEIRGYWSTTDKIPFEGTWDSLESATKAIQEMLGGVDPSTYSGT